MAPNDYLYTKLKNLQLGNRFNVYGIITEILKDKGLTQKGRLHSICRVKDESLPANSTFKIHFFLPAHHRLDGLIPGNIIRLHRLRVEEYQGEKDGRVLSGTDVVTFSSTPKDGTFHSEAKLITLTDDDKKRLEELREMIQVEKMFGDDESSLLTVTASQRIVFKGYEQQKSPSRHNENKYKSDGNDEDDPNEEDSVGSKVKQECSAKLFNPASVKNIVLNPLHRSFAYNKSNKRKIPEESQKNGDKIRTLMTPVPSTSSNEGFIVASCNSKKPLNENHGRQSSSKAELHTEMVPKALMANDYQEQYEQSSFFELAHSNKSSPIKKNITHDKGTKGQNTKASPVKKKFAHDKDEDLRLSEEECPGLTCGGKNCFFEGLALLKDDDPRLANFNENTLVRQGLGDIPAADEDGNICPVDTEMPFGDGSRAKEATVGDLLHFRWPRLRSKVKIIKIKPSIKYLNSNGARNLLSGICLQCGAYSLYSQLKWQRERTTKKPLCPFCVEDGKITTVIIEFRIKITVQDAWGTTLDVYAVKNNASKLLGCSPKEFQIEEICQKKVVALLSNAISSKSIFTITLFRMQTMTKSMFYICETNLSEALCEG